jgi:hypothetical protein
MELGQFLILVVQSTDDMLCQKQAYFAFEMFEFFGCHYPEIFVSSTPAHA